MGAPYQWSSDITKQCHIMHVKTPYCLSNHCNFHKQCCHFLDRQEKQRFFQLYTTLKTAHAPLIDEIRLEAGLMQLYHTELTSGHFIDTDVSGVELSISLPAENKSIFERPYSQVSADNKSALLLACHPHFPNLDIDNTSQILGVNDLRSALGDFFSGCSYHARNGRHYATSQCPLPFTSLCTWNKFCIQHHSVQDPLSFVPPQTIQAVPPSSTLPFGQASTVLIVHESGEFISTNMNSECTCL